MALLSCCFIARAQINTDQVMKIGRNALYFEDYVLSIQYFNQVISAKPYMAEPYYFRSVAKISLDDYRGAEQDASLCIERNPFIVDAYQVRGVARQNQSRFREAIDDYRAGLELSPYDKSLLLNMAACLIELHSLDTAATTLELVSRLDPKNDRVMLAIAHLHLEQGDTARAVADADSCLRMNSGNLQAHLLIAQTAVQRDSFDLALNHLNSAVQLEPRKAAFYINRAYVKYKLDDYYGAMADFDYAVTLEPANVTALYNRAMLCAEVAEDAKAIDGFSAVLRAEPSNFLALYNRALLYMKTSQYRLAMADYDAVLKRYPNFEAGYMARSEAKRRLGDRVGSERDINTAVGIMKRKGVHHSDYNPAHDEQKRIAAQMKSDSLPEPTEDEIMTRYNEMLTVDVDDGVPPEYANRSRGHVQNARLDIAPEPFFMVTYRFGTDDDLSAKRHHYMREITALNDTRLLPATLIIDCHDTPMTGDDIGMRFASIDYYNGLISQGNPRAVDYLARAIDNLMVKNTDAAIADADHALLLTPNEPAAYFIRACARYRAYQLASVPAEVTPATSTSSTAVPDIAAGSESMLKEREAAHMLDDVLDDLNSVVKLSPRNAYARYNIATVYNDKKNTTAAIAALTEAIDLQPGFGEAYFNRGLLYLSLGNKVAAMADLSKAGELGILPSYNVLKRFN